MTVSFVAIASGYAAENSITDISVMSSNQSQALIGEELTNGDFYLYNVGSQNYITAGNAWGTRSSFGSDGYTFTLSTSGTTTTISTDKYYAGKFLGSNGFVDSNSFGWTFTNIGDGDEYIYTITGESNILGFEEGSTEVSLTLKDATSDNAKWLVISKEQLIKNLSFATVENPINVTPFIINANFGRATKTNMWKGTQPAIGGDGNDPYRAYFVGEIFKDKKQTYDMYQTIEGVPNGKYILEAKGFIRDGSIEESTKRRENGSEILDTYLYINDVKTPLKSIYDQDVELSYGTSTSLGLIPNNMGEAAKYMHSGNYSGIVVEAVVTNNTLKLGIMSDGNFQTSYWALFDDFKLTYYGDVDLSEIKATFDKTLAEAIDKLDNEAYSIITGTERSLLAIAVDIKEPTDQEGYIAAINNLQAALDAFNNSRSEYQSLVNKIADFEKYSETYYPYASASLRTEFIKYEDYSPIDGKNALATSEIITSAIRKYVESHALAAGVSGSVNLTDLIVNPNATETTSKDENNMVVFPGWTKESSVNMGVLSNESFTDGDGNNNYSYFDGWSQKAWKTDFYQEIKLAKGKYMLTVTGRASNANTYVVYANSDTHDIPAIGSTGGVFDRGYNDASVEFTLTEDGSAKIGVNADLPDGQWLSFTRFRLVKLGNYIPTSIEDVEVVAPNIPLDIYRVLEDE